LETEDAKLLAYTGKLSNRIAFYRENNIFFDVSVQSVDRLNKDNICVTDAGHQVHPDHQNIRPFIFL
jgi:hypothetical protein